MLLPRNQAFDPSTNSFSWSDPGSSRPSWLKHVRRPRNRHPFTTAMLAAAIVVSAGLPADTEAAPATQTLSLTSSSGSFVVSGNVAMKVDFDVEADKVIFDLAGPSTARDTERSAPYYFGGDKNGVPRGWDTTQVPDGHYTLTATAIDGRREVGQKVFRFEVRNDVVIAPAPTDPTPSPTPVAPTPVEPAPTLTDDPLTVGTITGVQDGGTVAGTLNIAADVWNDVPANVVFELTGPVSMKHTEVVAPYYFKGDRNGNPRGWDTATAPDGDYELRVYAVDADDTASAAKVVGFTVDNVPDAPAQPEEPQITPPAPDPEPTTPAQPEPVTPTVDTVIEGFTGIPAGNLLSGKVNIAAAVTGTQPGRVDFALQGPQPMSHRESEAPYYFGGDTNGNPRGWDTTQMPNGRYSLTAVAYLDGETLSRRTVVFDILNDLTPVLDPTTPTTPTVTPTPDPEPSPTVDPTPDPDPTPSVADPKPIPADLSGAPVLKPATSDQTASTPNMNQVGTGYAADKPAIARWDVVPWQSFNEPFAVGVMAFHANGIDRVEFSVNGGPWSAVTEMTVNPRTGVEEYVAVLDPAKLPRGKVQVSAVAYPKAGKPKVVPVRNENTLVLYNDAGPKRVIRVGQDASSLEDAVNKAGNGEGVVVELPAGTHRLPEAVKLDGGNQRWFTVTAAPGVDRDKVVLENGDGYKFGGARVKIANVKLMSHLMGNETKASALWLDNVEYTEGNERDGREIKRFDGGEWYTDSYIHDLRFGAGDFVRGTHFDEIGEDVLRSYYAIINTRMTNLKRPAGTKYHGDIGERPFGNDVIIYGLKVRNGSVEGYEGGPQTINGFAIVNSDIENDKAYVWGSRQPDTVFRNVYTKDSRFVGLSVLRNSGRFHTRVDTFTIENSTFNGNQAPTNWYEVGATVRGFVGAD